MVAPQPPRRQGALTRIIAAMLLVAPFVALLWVPWYARTEPALAGVPFFYWYQFAWIPLSVASMSLAYLLLHRSGARRQQH